MVHQRLVRPSVGQRGQGEFDGLPIMLRRLVQPARLAHGVGEVVVDCGEARLELEGLPAAPNRVLDAPGLEIVVAEIAIGDIVIVVYSQ